MQSHENTTWLTEVSAKAGKVLGHPLDQPTLKSLTDIGDEFQSAKAALVADLKNGAIMPDDYLDKFNAALKTSMGKMRFLLGDVAFLAAFGRAGLHPEGAVDRKTFLDQFPKPAP